MEQYALGPQVADFLDSSPGHDAILGVEELGVLDNWQGENAMSVQSPAHCFRLISYVRFILISDDEPTLPELSVENEENLASEVSDFKQLYTRLSDDSNLATVTTEAGTKDVLPCLSMCKSTDECPSEQGTSDASANEVTGPDNPSTSVAAKVNQAAPTAVFNNRAANLTAKHTIIHGITTAGCTIILTQAWRIQDIAITINVITPTIRKVIITEDRIPPSITLLPKARI